MRDVVLERTAFWHSAWRWDVTAGRLAIAVAVLAAWKVGADAAGPLYIADPFTVIQRLVDSTASGSLIHHVLVTVRLSTLGFLAGCSAGLALPLLLYPWPRLLAAWEPFILGSAGIPKYAVVPLLILWLGIDDAPKLWLVGLLVFYPVFIAVLAGIRNVDRRLMNMVRVLGASPATATRVVVWNSMLPFFFAALRISVPRAVTAAVIGEFLVGGDGIGHLIESSRQNVDTVGVFAGLVVATALVVAATTVVHQIERHVVAWRSSERQLPI